MKSYLVDLSRPTGNRLGVLLLALIATPDATGVEVPDHPILVLDANGHTGPVRKVFFTPDGRTLITVSEDKTIRTWDVATGQPIRVFHPPIGTGRQGSLNAAAIAPDGQTLAVAGTGFLNGATPISLIDLTEGRIRAILTGHSQAITNLAFSPDGQRLASCSVDRTARLWNVRRAQIQRVLAGHSSSVYGLGFSPDGLLLATSSYDTTGRIWSVANGATLAVLPGHARGAHCLAWRPDGHLLAIGGNDHALRFWAPDGTPRGAWADMNSPILSLAFRSDSRQLLLTRGEENVYTCSLLDLETGREQVRFARHSSNVLHGVYSPDDRTIATTGGDDQETFLWRAADGAVLYRLASEGKVVSAAAWSPDSTIVAWGNHARPGDLLRASAPIERAFRLADLEFVPVPAGEERRGLLTRGPVSLQVNEKATCVLVQGRQAVASLRLPVSYDEVRSLTYLPDGRVVLGSFYGLYLFDPGSPTPVRTFQGHTGEVRALAPSPDGRYLLSASDDQTLRIWDPERKVPLVSLFFAGDDWIAWTPEGYYAASPGGERLMGWHVNNGPEVMASYYPAAKFHKTLYRPDVIKRLLTAGSLDRALADADRDAKRTSARVVVADVLPPRVRITAPRRSVLTVSSPRLEVQATARSVGKNPVTALRLLLDGRPYQGQKGLKLLETPRLGNVDARWDVELEPGAHRLAVQADSTVSQGVSDDVEVDYEAGGRANEVVLPNLYVLALGISEYPGDLRLNYAAKDAQAIDQTFRVKSRALFRNVDVKLLTDAGATRAEFLRGLTWLRKQMTQNDVAVIFFSGHGLKDSDTMLYLLPIDGDPQDLLTTAVSGDQLKSTLAGIPGRIIALLDACHAGAVGGDRRRAGDALTDDLVRDLVRDDYGVVTMASSMGREYSLESNAQRQGYFTFALTEGLSGKADFNHDGQVYLHELDTYVTDRVKDLTKGQQHPVTAKPTTVGPLPLSRP